MAGVRVEVGDGGGLVVVKEAVGRDGAEALRREAEALGRARHPGVVAVVGLEAGHGGATRLVTAWAGGRTAADLRRLTAPAALALVAAVAEALAHLHQVGVVHGAVRPDHVVVDGGLRPVLCSFGAAGPPGGGRSPSDDVAGLGRVADHLVAVVEASPAPPWRQRPRHRRQLDRLRAVAAQARASDPADRPGARLVAIAAGGAGGASRTSGTAGTGGASGAGGASRTGGAGGRATAGEGWARRAAPTGGPGGDGRRPWSGERRGAVVALLRRGAVGGLGLATALAATVVAVGWVDGTRSGSATPQVADPDLVDAPGPTTRAGAPADGPDRGGSGAPPSPDPPVVLVGGHRYAVGEPGDEALAADWRCDGTTAVAVLRPTTGAVFLFDQPAGGGGDGAVAHPLARVPPGGRLVAPPAGSACPPLAVLGPDGRVTAVPLGDRP